MLQAGLGTSPGPGATPGSRHASAGQTRCRLRVPDQPRPGFPRGVNRASRSKISNSGGRTLSALPRSGQNKGNFPNKRSHCCQVRDEGPAEPRSHRLGKRTPSGRPSGRPQHAPSRRPGRGPPGRRGWGWAGAGPAPPTAAVLTSPARASWLWRHRVWRRGSAAVGAAQGARGSGVSGPARRVGRPSARFRSVPHLGGSQRFLRPGAGLSGARTRRRWTEDVAGILWAAEAHGARGPGPGARRCGGASGRAAPVLGPPQTAGRRPRGEGRRGGCFRSWPRPGPWHLRCPHGGHSPSQPESRPGLPEHRCWGGWGAGVEEASGQFVKSTTFPESGGVRREAAPQRPPPLGPGCWPELPAGRYPPASKTWRRCVALGVTHLLR